MTTARKRPAPGQRTIDGGIHCLRCGRLLVDPAAVRRQYGRGCWRRQVAEWQAEEQGGVCRVCGCTDLVACPGGCYWVEPDLCSQCAAKAAITQDPKEERLR